MTGEKRSNAVKTIRSALTAFAAAGMIWTCSAAGAATGATNQSDYRPGQTVVITGAEWVPGESVELDIISECGCTKWLGFAEADADGNIFNNGFVVQDEHLGVSFTLNALGDQGSSASTTFTDSCNSDLTVTGGS